jgi:copper homeostasis protein
MKKILFELCVETTMAAQAAQLGGADRVELCSALNIGGVTPGESLIAATIQALTIPVHVLIRPRGGDFDYSAGEFGQLKDQIRWAKRAGAAGVALGVLLTNGQVDVPRSRALVELARPMSVTFHRAFDETPDLKEALEAVIETGADCLLTSGGESDVLTGAQQIARLVAQAGERIEIMAGGGLKLASLLEVVARTGVRRIHGSLTRRAADRVPGIGIGPVLSGSASILEADVRTAVALLHGRLKAAQPPASSTGQELASPALLKLE